MQKVDFFLIGWPKTGSTSLHYYLSQHPDIYMSNVKESYFFCTDILRESDAFGSGRFFTHRTEADYQKLFNGWNNERLVGESSVFYCISNEAIGNIKSQYPDAKILVILRDPVELVDSWFSYLKLHSRESAPDLETALQQQTERAEGINLPPNTHAPIHLQYDLLVDFPRHLARIFDHFERNSIHVIFYDEFCDRVAEVVADTFEFLGVDSSFTPDFSRKNVSRKPKNARLKQLIDKNKTGLTNILKRARLLKSNGPLHRLYLRIFTTNQSRGKVSDERKLRLKNRYRQSLIDASQLLGTDLTDRWKY